MLSSSLNTSISGYTDTDRVSFSASMDASHSLVREGMSSVTDGNGHAIGGYTVTSDSGTDWSRNLSAVPEPDAPLSMLAGLGLVGLRRRARLARRQ